MGNRVSSKLRLLFEIGAARLLVSLKKTYFTDKKYWRYWIAVLIAVAAQILSTLPTILTPHFVQELTILQPNGTVVNTVSFKGKGNPIFAVLVEGNNINKAAFDALGRHVPKATVGSRWRVVPEYTSNRTATPPPDGTLVFSTHFQYAGSQCVVGAECREQGLHLTANITLLSNDVNDVDALAAMFEGYQRVNHVLQLGMERYTDDSKELLNIYGSQVKTTLEGWTQIGVGGRRTCGMSASGLTVRYPNNLRYTQGWKDIATIPPHTLGPKQNVTLTLKQVVGPRAWHMYALVTETGAYIRRSSLSCMRGIDYISQSVESDGSKRTSYASSIVLERGDVDNLDNLDVLYAAGAVLTGAQFDEGVVYGSNVIMYKLTWAWCVASYTVLLFATVLIAAAYRRDRATLQMPLLAYVSNSIFSEAVDCQDPDLMRHEVALQIDSMGRHLGLTVQGLQLRQAVGQSGDDWADFSGDTKRVCGHSQGLTAPEWFADNKACVLDEPDHNLHDIVEDICHCAIKALIAADDALLSTKNYPDSPPNC